VSSKIIRVDAFEKTSAAELTAVLYVFNGNKDNETNEQVLFQYFSYMFSKIISTDQSRSTLLIRLMIGMVFLSEGIQKFLFPAIRGAGRFEKIGLPSPEFLGHFVGAFEVICGVFIIIGLLTRLSAIPLLIIVLVAISTTKVEVFATAGFWEMMHGSRTDWSMLLGSIFLMIKGGGCWSIDHKWSSSRK
jgi:putative oxidoreductase